MSTRTLSEALDGLRFAMVATEDATSGQWRARPLAVAAADGSVLSFLVSVGADWVEGMPDGGAPTTVTLSDPGKNAYVALQGQARLSQDRARIAELWNVGAASWFDGQDDPQVRVLSITVDHGEFWDGPSGRVGQLLQMAKAAAGLETGEQGDVVAG